MGFYSMDIIYYLLLKQSKQAMSSRDFSEDVKEEALMLSVESSIVETETKTPESSSILYNVEKVSEYMDDMTIAFTECYRATQQQQQLTHTRTSQNQATRRKMDRRAPTQFIYPRAESMILRSGNAINGVANSQIGMELNAIKTANNTSNTPNYGYCRTCFIIFALFEFLEKYHKEIRGEERNIHGSPSEWLRLYSTVRDKLEEFIGYIDRWGCHCKCGEENHSLRGTIYKNIRLMESLSRRDDYVEMADYTGYGGPEREKYRMYHRNFFVVDEVEDDDGSVLCYTISRDFEKTRDELLHWQKYFSQEHQSVLDAAEDALSFKNIGNDCVGEIMKFL